MSAYASVGSSYPPPSFSSRPCPHSWRNTPAISPVLLQPPPDLKKLTEDPFQYALQVWSRSMLSVSCCWSHVLLGSQ